MMLAEVETFLSRPIAPTRRVAIGRLELPVDPAPGFGGILLGAIAARFAPEIDSDMHAEILQLMSQLEAGNSIPQPKLRHRLQEDTVGLQRCVHRVIGQGEHLEFQFEEDQGTPAQHVLCAAYAAARVPWDAVPAVMSTVHKGLMWQGGSESALLAYLSGRSGVVAISSVGDPISWALAMLDLRDPEAPSPSRKDVQRAFRTRLRAAHPDHGAADDSAAARITELTEARRILLG
jgi:hypothetical protein